MASLLESLLSQRVVRKDNVRLKITPRPGPASQRETFDLLGLLGRDGNADMLRRGLDPADASPLVMTAAVLGRWPTAAELAELTGSGPYRAWPHLRQLLISEEFRGPILRRVLDSYQERRRILFAQVPRCAGAHIRHALASEHSLLPHTVEAREINGVVRALSPVLSRLRVGRTVSVAHTHVAAFLTGAPRGDAAEDPLGMAWRPALFRNGDLLFTVVRPPAEILVSQANAFLTEMRATPNGARAAHWAKRLGKLPALDNMKAWRDIGHQVLMHVKLVNPICTTLADGTAQAVLELCRTTPIRLAIRSSVDLFMQSELSVSPEPAVNVSEPILSVESLPPQAAAFVAERTAEDQKVWDKIAAYLEKDPVSFIVGPKLVA